MLKVMKCAEDERSLIMVMDGNFNRFGGEIMSPHMGYRMFGARFVDFFDRVVIAARAFDGTRSVGEAVTGPKVKFLDLGSNRGAVSLLLSTPRLIGRLWRVVGSPGVILIRFPGNIAVFTMLLCLLSGRKFSAEIVADPADYFSEAASTHPLRRVAKVAHVYFTKLAARKSQSVRYVTSRYLQDKYPSTPEIAFGFSDVYLPDSLFSDSSVSHEKLNARDFSLVNIGMMHNHSKGHIVLLDAVAELRQRGVAIRLSLVGDGALRKEFEAYARRLMIEDVVDFVGVISAEEVHALLRKHHLFVLTSFQEGMPRAMLEAMAVGLPVLATKVGGIPDVLPPQQLVCAGDRPELVKAIERLVRDRTLLASQSRQQQHVAMEFSEEKLRSKYAAYCNRLFEAR
nr:glycosyltransferase family 4 protein [Cupriavidus sp. LEh25]